MTLDKRKVALIVSVLVLLCLIALGGYFFFTNKPPMVSPTDVLQLDRSKKNHRIIVLVHGTFGSTLGLLDIPSVVRDNLKGSIYTKSARSMRKDEYFFGGQPLLHRGLVKIDPDFSIREKVGFVAAHPVCKSFDELCEGNLFKDEIRHYYLFGWSGLLSQTKRRIEALRFINCLNEEVKKFREQGIEPKISLFCHSHGGNVALNMGLIFAALKDEQLTDIPGVVHQKAYESIKTLLASASDKTKCSYYAGQKRWDYKPEVPTWKVEHLVLLGVPIQPESDFAVWSTLFEKIYDCYSYADRVQTSDWVSSGRFYSDARFDRLADICAKNNAALPEHLIQIRLMLDRELSENNSFVLPKEHEKGFTWWDLLVGHTVPQIVRRDPTHKELWFLVFDGHSTEGNPCKPLPIVSFMPCILNVVNSIDGHHDIDLNIALRREEICFEVADHNVGKVISRNVLNKKFVAALHDKAKDWQIASDVVQKEEILISRHLRLGREC